MFESAELGHRVDKQTWNEEEPALRSALLAAQYALLAQKKTAVVVVIAGVDGAGKGETVNLLNEWMDPRHVRTHAFAAPSDEEEDRPPMWRFWRALPPRGRIGILFGSWYTDPIVHRVEGETSKAGLDQSVEAIRHFERMLTQENVLLVKLWFHLSKKAQKKRLKELEKDPDTRWRVTREDWQRFETYERFRKVSEYVLRETSTGEAPWTVVEGADHRYRSLAAGKLLLSALQERLATKAPPAAEPAAPLPKEPIDGRHVLRSLKYDQQVEKKRYEKELEKWQGELNLLARHPRFRRRSCVLVFEGQDAAGKGGAIRRITAALDARHYGIIPVAAPTEEERAQPYLWRFWRHLPRQGHVAIFDRSWYGRVLVERVEGFCDEAAWMRAYAEINDFEEQLDRHGVVVSKFWLAITPDEQLRRFKEREKTDYKKFKITDEDWRNREKWPQYERAVCDMVDRTSTEMAPWTLVEANDKYSARLKILKTLCRQWEEALSHRR
ncbi:MAG TPA: polyphosphate:AMP phosphotransferase [Myxococcales bacterium]|jgi:polyphosphate:AMP phosphotransferase